MPKAKTWRLCTARGAAEGLRIESMRLMQASIELDGSAVLTSSIAPTEGVVEGIRSGAGCRYDAEDVMSAGFYIQWSFDVAVSVDGLLFEGAGLSGGILLGDGAPYVFTTKINNTFAVVDALSSLLAINPKYLFPLSQDAATQTDLVSALVANRSGGSIVTVPEQVGQPKAFSADSSGYVSANIGGFSSGDFSVIFDLRTTGVENRVVLECGDNIGFSVQVNIGGFIKLNVGWVTQGSPGALNSNFFVGDDTLRRIAVTFRRADKRACLYVDGGVIATDVLTLPTPSSILTIGSRLGSFPIQGCIANVALYTRELSAAEVAAAVYRGAAGWLGSPARVRSVLRSPRQAELPPTTALHAMPQRVDAEFAGVGFLYGTVREEKGRSMLQRRVRLFRSRDGLLVRETWSAADGSYRFDDISDRYEYDIEAWDHEKNYFTTVANNQLPEVV